MSNPWHKIDSTLNETGEWLLVGSIACATLPPLIGIFGCMTLLIVAANKSDRKVEKWERNILKMKFDFDIATKKEEQAYLKLIDKLERAKTNRQVANFTTGYISIYLALAYLGIKQYLISNEQVLTINDQLIFLPEWLIKGCFGSL